MDGVDATSNLTDASDVAATIRPHSERNAGDSEWSIMIGGNVSLDTDVLRIDPFERQEGEPASRDRPTFDD